MKNRSIEVKYSAGGIATKPLKRFGIYFRNSNDQLRLRKTPANIQKNNCMMKIDADLGMVSFVYPVEEMNPREFKWPSGVSVCVAESFDKLDIVERELNSPSTAIFKLNREKFEWFYDAFLDDENIVDGAIAIKVRKSAKTDVISKGTNAVDLFKKFIEKKVYSVRKEVYSMSDGEFLKEEELFKHVSSKEAIEIMRDEVAFKNEEKNSLKNKSLDFSGLNSSEFDFADKHGLTPDELGTLALSDDESSFLRDLNKRKRLPKNNR